jgi:hypothetical protein
MRRSIILIVPGALQKRFIEILLEKGVLSGQQSAYLKWLRYYLDFYQKYCFEEKQPESMAPFVKKLQEKRQSVMQLEQARKAIGLFSQVTGGDSCQINIGTAEPIEPYGERKTGPLENIGEQALFHAGSVALPQNVQANNTV